MLVGDSAAATMLLAAAKVEKPVERLL